MKLIFLDIDGVLNNMFDGYKADLFNTSLPNHYINKNNLEVLRYLTESTKANIVISSSWRKNSSIINQDLKENEKINEFVKIFANYGWDNAPIVGIAPNYSGFRGIEIALFLDKFNKNIDYIILDDDSDFILDDIEMSVPLHIKHKLEDIDVSSKYWKNQPLCKINRLLGLNVLDIVPVLKKWNKNDLLLNEVKNQPVDFLI